MTRAERHQWLEDYAGWPDCVWIRHGETTLVATTAVGPRIIHLSLDGKENVFHEFPDQLGAMEADTYLLLGGHRLWHAPEAFPRSYGRDLFPLTHVWQDETLRLEQKVEADTGIIKALEISCLKSGGFQIRHELTNGGLWPIRLAPWSMTLMRGGSRAVIPQETYRTHEDCLDPARSLTLWHYTKMNDPRVRWGEHFIELYEDAHIAGKFKLGLMNRQGWAACWTPGGLFIKTFSYHHGSDYPDFGCNTEIFTMPGFLELESLGPLETLAPGATAKHDEFWHLWPAETLPDDEPGLGEALAPYLAQLRFPGAAA
jgi:hypothetical protein